MPSVETFGSTLPLGPKSLKAKCSAFAHNGSAGLKRPAPARLPVTDNHRGTGAKGATGCGREVWEFLVWHKGYLLCPDLLLQSLLPNLYHLGYYRKTITKRFTRPLLCCWDGQIFSHQFLVVPEYPTLLLGRGLSLPSKSCSHCSPDRRCFKTLSWGQTIFTNHQVNNSWMGEAVNVCQIKESSDIKQCWWKMRACLSPFVRCLTQLPFCLPPIA